MKLKTFFIALISSMMTFASAQAALVTWTLNDFVFDDGGTASGTFAYDADTATYSNISITTTEGLALGGDSYILLNPSPSLQAAPDTLFAVTAAQADLTGTGFLGILWASSLTNAGGTIQLDYSGIGEPGNGGTEAICIFERCQGPPDFRRFLESGFITATPASEVPLPAAFWFMGMGIAAYRTARKKKAAT